MDRLIRFALRQRVFVLAAIAAIGLLGWLSFLGLPIDVFPDPSPPLVQVYTEADGMSPEEIERLVSFPVESALTGLPGTRTVRSLSTFALSLVNVYFREGTDIYWARQVVTERLREVEGTLPDGVENPVLGPVATGLGLVYVYYLEGDAGQSPMELRAIQDWLVKYELSSIPEVSRVLSIGGDVRQYQILVRPQSLQKYGLTLDEVMATVRAGNRNTGASFITRGREEYVVQSIGLVRDLEDLSSMMVAESGGTPVLLGDLADVRIGPAIRRGAALANGQGERVTGMVLKLFGANTANVIRDLEARIEVLNRSLPDGVRIVPFYNQASLVEQTFSTVRVNLAAAIVLVTAVLFVFMGHFVSALIAVLALPFSIFFAFILMDRIGLSADLMSFGGLAIAVGLIADAAIIFVENIDRKYRLAPDDKAGAVAAAGAEVGRPLVFAILIIILVFLPIFTLTGTEGIMFRPMGYTISFGLAGSLLFAIFAVPVLSYVLMRRKRTRPGRRVAGGQASGVVAGAESATAVGNAGEVFPGEGPGAVSSIAPKAGRAAGSGGTGEAGWVARAEAAAAASAEPPLVRKLKRAYLAAFSACERHRRRVFLATGAVAIAGLALLPFMGREYMPTLEEGTLHLRVTLDPNISLDESVKIAAGIEQDVLALPEADGVLTRIGKGEVGSHAHFVNDLEILIRLKPRRGWGRDRSKDEIVEDIEHRLERRPGLALNMTQPIAHNLDELITGVKAQLAVKIYGEDFEILKELGHQVRDVLAEQPGAADVQVEQFTGQNHIRVVLERARIARYGLAIEDIQETIRAAVGGAVLGQVFEGRRRFDIFLRYAPEYRSDVRDIQDMLVPLPNGGRIPLGELAAVEETMGPRQIQRENNKRFITVQGNVRGTDLGRFVERARRAVESEVELPPEYLVEWGGQHELQRSANRRLALIMPLTLGLVVLLMFTVFQSARTVLVLLLNIPLALVGGLLALKLGGLYLSVPASIGFIAIFGISLEDGMVLLSAFQERRRRGMSVAEAVRDGVAVKLRPVLMTTFTTVFGVLPLLLAQGPGAEIQRPLATVVAGGLLTSTLVTLIVLPLVYQSLQKEARDS